MTCKAAFRCTGRSELRRQERQTARRVFASKVRACRVAPARMWPNGNETGPVDTAARGAAASPAPFAEALPQPMQPLGHFRIANTCPPPRIVYRVRLLLHETIPVQPPGKRRTVTAKIAKRIGVRWHNEPRTPHECADFGGFRGSAACAHLKVLLVRATPKEVGSVMNGLNRTQNPATSVRDTRSAKPSPDRSKRPALHRYPPRSGSRICLRRSLRQDR